MIKTKVITGPNTRLSYFHGWNPVSINGGPERYGTTVLIPKDDTETITLVNNIIMITSIILKYAPFLLFTLFILSYSPLLY